MFYRLDIEITIAGKTFRRVNEVEIVNTVDALEDRARIVIPTTARLERAGEFITEVETAKTFAPGDEVLIKAGYNGELYEEFRGFVRRIQPNIPVVVECEDETYLLRRKRISGSWKNALLIQIIREVLSGTGVSLVGEIPTIRFQAFYVRDTTPARVLQRLREEYGLTIYFKGWKELVVSLSDQADGTTVKYETGLNVIDTDLEWIDEQDIDLEIKAVLIKPDNTQVEKKVGIPGGELRTIYLYDIAEDSLETRAKEELRKYTYSGYRGSFQGFLLPRVERGNVVSFTDSNFQERAGNYFVEEVKTTISTSGGRRAIKIGIRA